MKRQGRPASRCFRIALALAGIAALLFPGAVLTGGCGKVTTSNLDEVAGTDVSSVVLNIEAAAAKVAPGGTLTLTINATTKSGAAASDGTRVTVTQSPALGTISPTSATTTSGKAEVTFTAGTKTGQTTVEAAAGKATVQYAITVESSSGTGTGTGGGGGTGGGNSADAIDISQVTWLDASAADFTVTATLSNIQINYPTISWDWTHPSSWPVENTVTGNLWVFAKIDGRWQAATFEWLRPTTDHSHLEAKTGEPPFIQAKASPISAWYPQHGEELCFMASTMTRNGIPSGSPRERSPIVKTTWP
jgi:hypothetical protein